MGFHVQGGVDIHKMFGLSEEEELMESFEVELRQTYACNHNALSKPQEVGHTTMHLSMLYLQFQHPFQALGGSMQHAASLRLNACLPGSAAETALCWMCTNWVIRGA